MFVFESNGQLFFGNLIAQRGCQIVNGVAERCYGEAYKDVQVGAVIDGKIVQQAPKEWTETAWMEDLSLPDDELGWASVATLGEGDWFFTELTIHDVKYPLLKWVIVKIHPNDEDLLYIVPFFEADDLGTIHDDTYSNVVFQNTIFAEDLEGQDHCVVCPMNGEWIHRLDVLGLEREGAKEHLVQPTKKYLSNLFTR